MANGERSQLPTGAAAFRQDLHSAIVDTQSRSGKASKSSNTLYERGLDYYRDSSGKISSPPDYPDTSYGAYLRQGGNLLGIGYFAWRDRLVNSYQMAYNEYQNWYNSAPQQKQRIVDAGLNTNLAYGAVSPGEAAGSPGGASSSPSPSEVAVNAASVLTGVFGNLKTLAETATIVAALPESQFKGRMASMLNAGAAAGKVNSENIYWSQLFGNRVASGVPVSRAQAEAAENALTISQKGAEKDYLEYMLTHGADGDLTDFEGSMFLQGRSSTVKSGILEYRKNKLQWDYVFSHPSYWQTMLSKAIDEGWITRGQAFGVRTILNDTSMPSTTKALALQTGLPGFFAKMSYFITSEGLKLPDRIKNPAGYTIKKGAEAINKGIKRFRNWSPRGYKSSTEYLMDSYTD